MEKCPDARLITRRGSRKVPSQLKLSQDCHILNMFLHGDNSEIETIFSKVKEINQQTESDVIVPCENDTPKTTEMTMEVSKILSNVIDLGNKYAQLQKEKTSESNTIMQLKSQIDNLTSDNERLKSEMETFKDKVCQQLASHEQQMHLIAQQNTHEVKLYLSKTDSAIKSISDIVNKSSSVGSSNVSLSGQTTQHAEIVTTAKTSPQKPLPRRPTDDPMKKPPSQIENEQTSATPPTFADVVRMPPRDSNRTQQHVTAETSVNNNEQLMYYDWHKTQYTRKVQNSDNERSNEKKTFDIPPGWRLIDSAEYRKPTDTDTSEHSRKIDTIVSSSRNNTEHRNPADQYPSANKNIKRVDTMTTPQNSKSTPVSSAFKGKYRGRIKMYYIGGIDRDSNLQGLEDYLQERYVTPLYASLFNSRNGDLAAKITVPMSQGARVEEHDFWPRFTRCRQWLSRNKWDEYRNNNNPSEYFDENNVNTENNAYYGDYNQPTDSQYRHDVDYSVANID
ncbi:MAG: hypothetical protein ABW185_29745 [Sedimenticola sp.]